LVSLLLIQWIAIYPVDSAIHRLNNWGLMDKNMPTLGFFQNQEKLSEFALNKIILLLS